MFTKTIKPTSNYVTIQLPDDFIGEEVKLIAVVEKQIPVIVSEKKSRESIRNTYSKYPKIDLSDFKFNRDEANDLE